MLPPPPSPPDSQTNEKADYEDERGKDCGHDDDPDRLSSRSGGNSTNASSQKVKRRNLDREVHLQL